MVLISTQSVGFLMAGHQDDRKTSWGNGSEIKKPSTYNCVFYEDKFSRPVYSEPRGTDSAFFFLPWTWKNKTCVSRLAKVVQWAYATTPALFISSPPQKHVLFT